MTEGNTDPLALVGTTIAEKYAIESVVGAGGFAVVYRAQHLLWKVPVALKVFNALGAVSREQREQLLQDFLQEGKLLTQLSAKTTAILQARDVAMLTTQTGESIPYMVLEWLEGKPLDVIIDEERKQGVQPRTLEQAVKLLEPIADALAIAHDQGIVHRDLKPANIFVLGDARQPMGVKLLDFGIAKVVQDAQKMGFAKTAGHVTSFTPYYGAPEQFDRTFGATAPATDVFALALVVTELISGREPMAGDSIVQLAYISCDPNKRPTPRTLGVALPEDTDAVFQRALAVKSEDRFPTAGAFWSALKSTAGMTSDSRISAPSPSSNQSNPRITGPGAFAATAVAPAATAPTLALEEPKKVKNPLFYPSLALMVFLLAAGGYVMATKAKGGDKPGPMASSTAPVASSSAPVASAAPSASALPSASKCPAGMAYVEGGDFLMGYAEHDATPNEKPVHPVKLGAYCLDIYEVTADKYLECAKSAKCVRQRDNAWTGITKAERTAYDPLCTLRTENEEKLAKHPANCVDWDQATAYCAFRGARLPTEAEWEFAARTADQRIYPWGDDAPTANHLNACGNECLAWQKAHPGADESPMSMYNASDPYPTTAPVGQFPAGKTRFGIYDMVGNVLEWTSDWMGPYAKSATPLSDPKGPAKGTERVIRGGAWNAYDPTWLRPSYRFSASPGTRTHGIGFRCAAAPKP